MQVQVATGSRRTNKSEYLKFFATWEERGKGEPRGGRNHCVLFALVLLFLAGAAVLPPPLALLPAVMVGHCGPTSLLVQGRISLEHGTVSPGLVLIRRGGVEPLLERCSSWECSVGMDSWTTRDQLRTAGPKGSSPCWSTVLLQILLLVDIKKILLGGLPKLCLKCCFNVWSLTGTGGRQREVDARVGFSELQIL